MPSKKVRDDRAVFRSAVQTGDTSLASALRSKRPVATARAAGRTAIKAAKAKRQLGHAGGRAAVKTAKKQRRVAVKAAKKQRGVERSKSIASLKRARSA